MCLGFFVGAIWLFICLDETLMEPDFSKINIGIIAERQSAQQEVVTTDIICNVSIEWHFVDFKEVFHVFKTITVLDQTRPDVDIIVLLGYRPGMQEVTLLPNTHNKQLITLGRDMHSHNQTVLERWMLEFTNTSLAKVSKRKRLRCNVYTNTSDIDSSYPSIGQTIMTAPSRILAQLIITQHWTSICVLHDSYTEFETRLFVDEISKNGSAFVIHNVDKVKDLHGLLLGNYKSTILAHQKINFVVICRLDCLMSVLKMANEFDSTDTEFPTLLRHFSRWLVVVHSYNSYVNSLLQTAAHDLDNIAMLPVPALDPPTEKDIPRRLKTSLNQLRMDNFSVTNDRKQFYLKRIVNAILLMEPTSVCNHYVIDTLLWNDAGREFHTVGQADVDGTVALESDLFPNTKYGYSNRRFKVTTEVYEPYVIESVTVDNETKLVGSYIDLLEELSRVLNFTYTIIRPPDGKWGTVERTENGTDIFNGMIGMLQRKEVDFAATPMTIIPVRDKVVDFSYPASHEYTTVVMKKPDPNAVKWRTLVNPLKLEVLLYIGVSLTVVTILMFLIEKFGPYYRCHNNAAVRKQQGGLHHLHDSFWYMYGALLCQGGVRLPDSFAGRTFVSAWWIFCIIIVGTYCGNLIAFLTVSKVVAPFNTIEEMVMLKGQFKWGTQGGTVWETIFTTSSNPDFKKVGDAMLEFSKSDSSILSPSQAVHVDKVKDGGYAWIADATSIALVMSKSCDLTTIKDRVLPITDAFAFQQNSPHTAIFSEQIMKSHEAGLFEIWRRKWWPKVNFCSDPAKPTSKPITLMDVQSAFFVCLIGIFFGSVAFISEIVIFRYRRNRGNNDSDPIEHVESSSNNRTTD